MKNTVSHENPLVRDIVDYANQQKDKIANGFNYLGLTDGYVPIETVEFLEQRAHEHVAIVNNAGTAFEAYLNKAKVLDEVQAELVDEQRMADKKLDIAIEQIHKATEQIKEIDEVLDDIADKRDFLTNEAVQFGMKLFLDAAINSSSGGADARTLPPIDGLISRSLNFFQRANELSHQKKRAEIQRRIAEHEQRIGRLGRDMAQFQRDFVEDKLRTTQGRDLNKDLYYRLANFFAQLAAQHIESAIRFAFQFERAVAFRYHNLNLRVLSDFYFPTDTAGLIKGGVQLNNIVQAIVDNKKPPGELDTFVLELSLRARYPIEFSLFQQTGRMQFAISLYDLDKVRPGTYDRRIIGLAVRPFGAGTLTEYSGTLAHPGTFLERDRESTLDPTTQRFIPTDDQLAAAFEKLHDGKVPGAAVGGVIPVQLDQDIKQLSVDTETLALHGSPDESTVKLFERYGAATLWTLELKGLDPRLLTDIKFHLLFEHLETDRALGAKVKELIKAYEVEVAQEHAVEKGLDRITMISMRQAFPDAFSQLATGQSSFVLGANRFPFGLTDLKVKTVIVQAINFDQNGAAGVHLKISKDDTSFTRDMTTGADGFSEDVNAAIPVSEQAKRFPVFGTWRIQLPNPAQFTQVFFKDGTKQGELRFLFVYEFKEI